MTASCICTDSGGVLYVSRQRRRLEYVQTMTASCIYEDNDGVKYMYRK